MTARVVTLGETMGLLSSETPGSLAYTGHLSLGIGGAESNTAIGLARLGVPVAWVGCVGEDSLGDRIVRELRGEGVQVLARRDPTAATGLMLKEHRTASTTNVWYYRRDSAGSRITPDDVPQQLIADADVLHLTGITPALSDSAAAAVGHAVDIARKSGTTVSLDINYRRLLWGPQQAAETLLPLLKSVDVLFSGEREARLFCAETLERRELALRLARLGPSEVVIKSGGDGAVGLADDDYAEQAAIEVTVVDTVGAGDAFAAGYLAERIEGGDLRARLAKGALLGAFACTSRSDWQGLPTPRDLAAGLGERVIR